MKIPTNHVRRAAKVAGVCMTAALFVGLMMLRGYAHKVNVFAYVEGDQVIVEGYFSGNVKAQNSPVEVLDETGKKILEGRTDKKGVYAFKLADLPPFSGGLKIVLEAEMGHRSEYTLSAADIPPSKAKETSAGTQSGKQETVKQETPQQEPPKQEIPKNQSLNAPAPSPVPAAPAPATTAVVDQAALTAALGAVLDKKLEPIVRMLGKQEKLLLEEKFGGPRLSDIVGGIGWILGLAGITAFFLSRKRPAK